MTGSISKRNLLPLLALVVAASAHTTSTAQTKVPSPGEGHRATPMEVAQLPQFCWAQYTEHKGPQYSIPGGCGPGMNHYCWGLVEELRANRVFDNPKQRLDLLRAAKGQTLYTLNAMKDYPGCVLRPHVEQTYQRIDTRIRAGGVR